MAPVLWAGDEGLSVYHFLCPPARRKRAWERIRAEAPGAIGPLKRALGTEGEDRACLPRAKGPGLRPPMAGKGR